MSSRPTTVLLGLGSTTQAAFEALNERFNVLAVVRPGEDAMVQKVRDAGIRVEPQTSISAVSALIDQLDPDVVVASSYNRVLPAALLERRPYVNVHYAPLPRYRGRATVNWAILNGETETAISIHCLVEGLDAGGILVQKFVPIGPRDTVMDLYWRLNALQRELLAGAVYRRLKGDLGEPQDEAAASYCCGRIPSDGMIDWAAPTLLIDRLVRSLGGDFPSAYTFLGAKKLEILSAEPGSDHRSFVGRIPGRIVGIDRHAGVVDVLTGDGALRVREVRLAGAMPQSAVDVISSSRMTLGLGTAEIAALFNELRTDLPNDFQQTLKGSTSNVAVLTRTALEQGRWT